MPIAMPWYLNTITNQYGQSVVLTFSITSGANPVTVTTSQITTYTNAGVSGTTLQISLVGTLVFAPQSNGTIVDVYFGDIHWVYTPSAGGTMSILIDSIGTPILQPSSATQLILLPGQAQLATVAAFSSSYNSLYFPATNLTNGNLTSFWCSNREPTSACNEFVTFDLGYSQPFARVILYPRWYTPLSGSSPQALCFPVAFQIFGSNDNSTWTSLGNYTNFPTPTSSAGVSLPVGQQTYQYVKLGFTQTSTDGSNYYVQLVQVVSYLAGWNATVVAYSSQLNTTTWAATNLTDGILTTSWSSLVTSSSCNEYVTIDLGVAEAFDCIVLYPRWYTPFSGSSPRALCFPVAFQIFGSNDNSTWTSLGNYTSFAAPASNTGVSLPVGPQQYRYLKLVFTQTSTDGANYYVQLAQVEILNMF